MGGRGSGGGGKGRSAGGGSASARKPVSERSLTELNKMNDDELGSVLRDSATGSRITTNQSFIDPKDRQQKFESWRKLKNGDWKNNSGETRESEQLGYIAQRAGVRKATLKNKA